MAVTTIQDNNKLIRFTKEINREFVRENMFSPYMGEDATAIIRVRSELKAGGEIMNIPIVTRLRGQGVTTGTLVGNEERIDNYGMRLRVDWARHAVVSNRAESQKDSADIFGEAKPLLSDWGKELQRDEILASMLAIPSATLPTSSRVNGIQFDLASEAQKDTWAITNNPDRVVYGASTGNKKATFALSLAELDTTADKLTAATVSLFKRVAMNADPKIRPFKTRDGYEYFVMFAGTNAFRDLKLDLNANVNLHARMREGDGLNKNPLFQDGDQLYDGCIIRVVPEISSFVNSGGPWNTALGLAGAGGTTRVEPVFVCGQQAVVLGWGQMARPTERKEDDYGFIQGTGIEMCYGVSKVFKAHPMESATKLVQFGMLNAFVASASD